MLRLRQTLILLTLGALVGAPSFAAPLLSVEWISDSEVPVGTLLSAPEAEPYGESFQWSAGLLAALTAADLDDILQLQGFPVAPGERLTVQLQRRQIYAEDSAIHLLGKGATTTLPRSRRSYFRGRSIDDPHLRVALSIDPENGEVRGLLLGPDGRHYEILVAPETPGQHLLRHVKRAEEEAGTTLQAHCDADVLPGGTTAAAPKIPFPKSAPVSNQGRHGAFSELGLPTLTAVVAVDTDNEFHHLKFGNNTTAATDYVADLFNEMNIMYERDLALQLLIGDTFFRLDTDNPPTYDDDPFNNVDSPASPAALDEFGIFWQNNMSAVDRVFAMLLSGKSSASNSASGIAWIDGYCESQNTGGGYSVNQIFRGNFPIINDARLVGHELGHNHGSPHTHCYNPPIDECSSIGTGCYDGSNGFNCPPEGPGTVMSYCNFSASNCGQNRLEFHPVVMSNLALFVAAHTFAGCIEPLVDPDELFSDGFEAGSSAGWDSAVP